MKVYSFDIYDTCVSRDCGIPQNVIKIVADILFPDSTISLKKEFVRQRRNAEVKAMKALNKESVTITEIYEYVDFSLFPQISKLDAVSKEISIDLDSLTPIAKTLSIIECCRKRGKVLFISDMYLPHDALHKRLKQIGVIKDDEKLYVSCEYNRTKKTGSLFKYVSERENIRFKNWVHYGDDDNNDIKQPSKLGIKCRKVSYDFNDLEKDWMGYTSVSGNHSFSIFSGISRSQRLLEGRKNKYNIITDIVGPIFISTAYYLIEKARKDNIRNIFYASRDPWLIYKVADILCKAKNDIENKYINISTKTIYPTIINNCSKEEICRFLDLIGSFSVNYVCGILGLDKKASDEITKRLDIAGSISSSDEKAMALASVLSEDPYKEIIIENAKVKTNLLIQYLRQEGVFTDEKSAIFDIGWRGRCQSVLRKYIPASLKFYYFGLHAQRLSLKDIDNYTSLTYCEDTIEFDIYRFIMEFFMCRSYEGSTIAYEKDNNGLIKSIKDERIIEEKERKEIATVEASVLKEAEVFCKYQKSFSDPAWLFNICSMQTLKKFICNPNTEYLKDLPESIEFDAFEHRFFITKKISVKDVLYFVHYHLVRRFKSIPAPQYVMWTKGTVLRSYGRLGEVIYNLCCNLRIILKR